MNQKTLDEVCEAAGITIYKLAKHIPVKYHTLCKRARSEWPVTYSDGVLTMYRLDGLKHEYEVDLDALVEMAEE